MPGPQVVKINERSHRMLKGLADRSGQPMTALLEQAIEHFRRQCFLEDANAAYRELRENPKAWKEELAEREAWDATLADGDER